MSEVNIRPVTAADIPVLLELMFQYIVDFYHWRRPDEADLHQLVEHLRTHPDAGVQFVAQTDDKGLVGFATLYTSFDTLEVKRIAVLHDLFVSPSARRQQIGEQLFQHCLAYVRQQGYARMVWETAADNANAQALYDKLGGRRSPWVHYEID